MEEEFNPYAPPKAEVFAPILGGGGGCWRRGKTIFLPVGGWLPGRCIKCNAPADGPAKARKIYWHSPWWSLFLFLVFPLFLFGLLIFMIVAICVRKSATIHPGLCAAHRKKRNLHIGITWALFVLALLMIFFAAKSGARFALPSCLLILGSLIYGSVLTRLLKVKRIDTHYIQLNGAGRPFLDSLPASESDARLTP